MKIHNIETCLNSKKRPPFRIGGDVILVGRGDKNKDRFLFNLDKVLVFFLNFSPPKWALDWYKREHPDSWKTKLFSFVHGVHLDDFLEIRETELDIITWKDAPRGIKTNNISNAAVGILKRLLKKKNIYLSAFDFDVKKQWVFDEKPNGVRDWRHEERSFEIEAKNLSEEIKREDQNKNKVLFLTFNRYFANYMSAGACEEIKANLEDAGIIKRELDPGQIDAEYAKSGIQKPKEPGELVREKYLAGIPKRNVVVRSSLKGWAEYQQAIWREPLGSKKLLSQKYRFNQFQGKRCFVIGGGPSLRGFDFDKLRDEFSIGVNKIGAVFQPTITFACDIVLLPFIRENATAKTTIVFCDRDNHQLNDLYYVRDRGLHGVPNSIDFIFSGNNSGYAAVNLAVAMGFDPIYLLGFDFALDPEGRDHVTDDWGIPGTPQSYKNDYLDKFRLEFEEMKHYINRKIINLNMESNLQAFPKIPFSSLQIGNRYPLEIKTNGRRWGVGNGPRVYGTETEARKAIEIMYKNRMEELQ